ncbi:MAG: LysM peptidoglycan-binding domain-containing protein [Chloroflexi bacterium]|nr:LysM peptidoglycan-binding domain-containing protein [Chloroflexota bacterium]
MRVRPTGGSIGLPAAIAVAAALFLALVAGASAGEPTSHTVAWGETLYSIARAYGVTPQSLAAANGLTLNSWVYAGQQLVIPADGASSARSGETPSGYYTVKGGDTLYSIAARFGTTVDILSTSNALPANGLVYVGWTLRVPASAAAPSKPSTQSYIVQNGEYLALIAMRFGTTAQAVALANSLPNTWLVYAGQRLTIPTALTQSSQTLPDAANAVRVANIPLYRQKQTLTCEEASAAMATRGAVSEAQLLSVLPHSDDPFAGIRGRTNSSYFGGLSDYGIYAHGLQRGLTALGVRSQLLYGQSYDDFKDALLSSLRAGHPVIWWHTWQDTFQSPVGVKLSNGSVVKLVPYEHAGVIVAANDEGITYNDPYDATVRFVSWADHRRVSAYFDNMALVIL